MQVPYIGNGRLSSTLFSYAQSQFTLEYVYMYVRTCCTRAAKDGLSVSLMERLHKLYGEEITFMLQVQYRYIYIYIYM